MKKTIIALSVAVASIATVPAMAAGSNTGALSSLGLQGQKSSYDTSGVEEDDSKEYGAYYSYGNKMTGEAGFIYELQANAGWGSESGIDTNVYDLGGDLGYRYSLDRATFADIVGGVGYEYVNADGDEGGELEIRTPYLKAGVALGRHFNSENTGRIELGTRYNFNSEIEVDNDVDSGKVDLEDKGNFYAEASLMNTSTGVPLEFAVYHRQNNVELDAPGSNKFDRDVTGVRVGFMF